ncbi:MAG: hypothetical protein GC165_20330 [Armatimonadetes bacterium]|nr:hypothetical protein [Armatimonadota bacterium]
MFKVITDKKWKKFCEAKSLPVDDAKFVLDTCYLGLTLRSRPGTLIVTEKELIHYSYSFTDTIFAIFEPSEKVTIPFADIAYVKKKTLSGRQNVFHGYPSAVYQVLTNQGESYDLLFQQRGDEFLTEIRQISVPIAD